MKKVQVNEVREKLAKYLTEGHTTEKKIQKVFSLLGEHQDSNMYKGLSLGDKHFQAAEQIIKKSQNPLRSLDAIHLGITSSENLTLFSFDKVMNQAANEFNIPTVEI